MMFKESFKYYKSRIPPPDFDEVVDFKREDSFSDKVRFLEPHQVEENEFPLLLRPVSEWKIFGLIDRPGLFFVENPWTEVGVRYWVCRSLQQLTRPPSKLNIDHDDHRGACLNIEHNDHRAAWWDEAQLKRTQDGGALLRRLRWATFGYHHNWDTKEYSEQNKCAFPEDLAAVCRYVADAVGGWSEFAAQAAILNFYHPDSTLSGHRDHSEPNMEAPLLSFRFGTHLQLNVLLVPLICSSLLKNRNGRAFLLAVMTVSLYDSIFCRLCGEENTNGILLYENDTNSGVDICSMINNYLPIKVADDGNFPRTICPGCNLQLHSTVQFFDLLIEGQKKIRELWKEQLNREKRREKQQQQQQSLLISKNRPQLIETTADIAELVSSQRQVTLDIQDSSAGFDLAAAILQASSDVTADDVSAANLQELDSLQLDQVLESGSGNIFVEDHGLVLRAAGLDRPRKKRGRPRKQVAAKADSADEPLPQTTADDQLTEQYQLDDADGRRRRKRQIPLRFREAVQGIELERILKEEGVTDGEDENESIFRVEGGGEGVGGGEGGDIVGDEDDPMKNRVSAVAPDREVIGHLETVDGQNMGELIIVNKKLTSLNANRLARWNNQKRRIRRRRKPRFFCEICGRTFMHIGKYRYHKSFHTGIKYECVECKRRFTAKENFDLHQKMTGHTGEGIVKESEEGSKENVEGGAEVVGGKLECRKCEKTFSTKQNLENHTRVVHELEKPYKCEICDRRFGYQNSLRCHILTHHEGGGGGDQTSQEGGGAFPCDICGRRLNHPSSVVYHKEAEHNDGRRFVCDRCGKAFKHKQLLHRHQLVHTDDRPHQCQTCQATFKTKANLLSHQSTHTGEKPHFCEICGQQFAYKTSLVLHYRWHSGQKPYQCEVCKKAFSQKGNLQEHLRIHTGEKPYSCVFCDKKFTTSSQFKLHMKRHTGERPWKCDTCGKTFLHKDTWKCHQRRHANVKPYTCHLCPRQFSEHYAMKKHMRLHTGERPYQCNYCGKLFSDCSNLAKHRKVHEREVNSEGGGGGVVLTEEGGGEGVVLAEEGGGGVVDQEVVEVGGGTMEFTGSENLWGVTTAQGADSEVQQIIYVTYQDPTDPSGKVCEKYLMPGVLTVGGGGAEGVEGGLQMAAKDATTLQFTDEHGNPFHITLNDNNELQVGLDDSSVDGGGVVGAATLDSYQSAILEAKASSNYIIKVTPDSLMNGDTSKLAATIEGDIPASYAFMIQNGSHKDQLVESFSTSVQIPAEYLNIN